MEYIAKWVAYFKTNPPLRDHLNTCIAQIPQAIFNTNLGRGQRSHSLEKFIIDYKKAMLPSRDEVNLKIHSVLGGIARRGKNG